MKHPYGPDQNLNRDVSSMLEMMRSKIKRKVRRFGRLASPRRFSRHQGGAAAVEFALILVPFLALMFGIMETALVFFADQTLETAVANSARLILTGQAQNQGLNATTFKNAVCARVYGLFNCQSGIYVNVQTYSSFGSISYSPPLDNKGNLVTTNFTYQPGGPGDIVVVQLYYQWPIYFTLMDFSSLSNMAGSSRLLVATAAFRNEPYN
jgi:Flp pilus assembly protein TadG